MGGESWMMARCSRWARKARCFVSLNTISVVQCTTQDFVIICSFEEVFFWDSLGFGSELNHVRKVFLIVLIIIKKQGLASFLVLHGDNLALAWLLSRSDWSVFKAEVMAGLLANIPFSSTCSTVFPRHLRAFWLFSGKKKKRGGAKGPSWAWKPSCFLVESRLFTVVLGAGAVPRLRAWVWLLSTTEASAMPEGTEPPSPTSAEGTDLCQKGDLIISANWGTNQIDAPNIQGIKSSSVCSERLTSLLPSEAIGQRAVRVGCKASTCCCNG